MKVEEASDVKHFIVFVIGVIIGLILIISFFGTFYIVHAGERAIVTTFGNPDLTPRTEGLHFKIPLVQKAIIMDTKTQTVSFDNKQGQGDNSEYSSLFASSKDLQDVQTAVVVNYHIEPDKVPYIYKTYGSFDIYKLNIIEPIIRDTVKTVTAEFTAEQLVQNRSEVAQRISELLEQRLSEKSAVFERINIVNFQYSAEFSKAIEEKQVAQQNALTEKNKLEMVQYQAQQRIAQAEGEAKAIAIQVNAINQQGGDNYVRLKMIEKWSGNLPTVSGGGNVFSVLNLNTLSLNQTS